MTTRTGLADALFTRTQQRLLGWLFGQPERSFFASELILLTGSGSGAVQRELKKLLDAGLVTSERLGLQRHYQANPQAPIFDELCSIARKTFGLAWPLQQALAPFASRIRAAFVYGSTARSEDHATSDIDLLVLSDDLAYSDLYAVLPALEQTLGRTVSPTLYSPQELQQRLTDGNAFVQRVLQRPKIWLIGGEDDLPT